MNCNIIVAFIDILVQIFIGFYAVRTLQATLNKVPIRPGIPKHTFKILSKRKWKDERNRICTLMFDEIQIQPHIDYLLEEDKVVGFEDDGTTRTRAVADHVAIFVIRGVYKRWKQPVTFAFSRAFNQDPLENFFGQVRQYGVRYTNPTCEVKLSISIDTVKIELEALVVEKMISNVDLILGQPTLSKGDVVLGGETELSQVSDLLGSLSVGDYGEMPKRKVVLSENPDCVTMVEVVLSEFEAEGNWAISPKLIGDGNNCVTLISPALTKNTKKGRYSHLTPMHKLYVALQFYATGTYQWMVGSSSRISQSATSKAIHEVTAALVEVAPQFIRFPAAAEYPTVKQAFYALGMTRHGAGFPNVLGAIDCTHVRIQKPSTEAPEQYLNRHLYYSINVQLVGEKETLFFSSPQRKPRKQESPRKPSDQGSLEERKPRSKYREPSPTKPRTQRTHTRWSTVNGSGPVHRWFVQKIPPYPKSSKKTNATQVRNRCGRHWTGGSANTAIDGGDHVIVDASQSLTHPETGYSTTEKECLAIVWVTKMAKVTKETDRWTIFLQQYDFEIKYRRGVLNRVADALSRQPAENKNVTDRTAASHRLTAPSLAAVWDDTITCPWYTKKLAEVENNPQAFSEYQIQNGRLYRHFWDMSESTKLDLGNPWKLCVPKPIQSTVLEENHDAPTTGHLGIAKTTARLALRYYWPGMFRDAAKYVRNCTSCQQYKSTQQQPPGKMCPSWNFLPWATVSTDLIGPLPRSSKAIDNNIMSPSQKEFGPWESCHEHNFILQYILDKTRRRRKRAAIAWLDLQRAFASIPQKRIIDRLNNLNLPQEILHLVFYMYINITSTICFGSEETTDPIPMKSGVRQGYLLCPIFFNLATDPLLKAAENCEGGFNTADKVIKILAYADDIVLIASNHEDLQRIMDAISAVANNMQIRFNVTKCAILDLDTKGNACHMTKLKIQNKEICPLHEGEAYQHLGIPTRYHVDTTPKATIERMTKEEISVRLDHDYILNEHQIFVGRYIEVGSPASPIMGCEMSTQTESEIQKKHVETQTELFELSKWTMQTQTGKELSAATPRKRKLKAEIRSKGEDVKKFRKKLDTRNKSLEENEKRQERGNLRRRIQASVRQIPATTIQQSTPSPQQFEEQKNKKKAIHKGIQTTRSGIKTEDLEKKKIDMEKLSDVPGLSDRINKSSVTVIRALHQLVFEKDSGRSNRRRLREFPGFVFENDEDFNAKVDWVSTNLTLGDLTAVCSILNIDYEGSIGELAGHICTKLTDLNSLISADEEEEKEPDDDNLSEASGASMRSNSTPHFSMTFRDIEDSMRPFNSDQSYPIAKWISDFEEVASLMGWNNTWIHLKKLLIREFHTKINSAELHQMLSRRKMQRNESVQEYSLIMKELASRGNIEMDAVIQYIVDGIPDEVDRKIILYEATTWEELKQKLDIYSRVKSKVSQRMAAASPPQKPSTSSISKVVQPTQVHNANPYTVLVNFSTKDEYDNTNIFSIDSLLDTGSPISLIKKQYVPSIMYESESVDQKFSGLNFSPVKIIARFRTTITASDISVPISFYVVPDDTMTFGIILGRDFMMSSNLEITFGTSFTIKQKPANALQNSDEFFKMLNINYLSESELTNNELRVSPDLRRNSIAMQVVTDLGQCYYKNSNLANFTQYFSLAIVQVKQKRNIIVLNLNV
ncbi:hypothetical protein TcasGA2_TC031350 [Tribolium castaneum]|uniref:RNA-directed DNA polymerase n=1 Tax=Tribolium castaneum TaxID=7070 RepID=A0A139WB30_TRICA|nr:hypothetical protein TcasGA2_TC031350 [Tribolium castaneum]